MDERDAQFLLDEKYAGVRSPEYEEDLRQLERGVPVDYLIGWKPFLSCKIFLDSHPLIPRTETEYWVEQAIEHIKVSRPPLPRLNMLDLFAGSGAVGVALLKHLPETCVDFGEIDAIHPPTILKNIHANEIDENRTRIVETDVWKNIPGRYDFIFANPPYLSRTHQERIQRSVIAYEPGVALFAAEDGFALIRKTIEGARERLLPEGTLFLEHEPEQSERISTLAVENGLTVQTHQDQFGLARWSAISVA